MKKIEKGKSEDLAWCSQNLEFRKYKARIVDASISGERTTKRRPTKAFIKIYKADLTSTEHSHTSLDTFGYYEWLEIREVIVKEKSAYKNHVIEEMTQLLDKMSKLLKIPPLAPRASRREAAAARPVIRNETSLKFSAE